MKDGWLSTGTQSVQDGKSLEFEWSGKKLGIRVQGETEYTYVDLQGPQGLKGDTGDTGPQGIQGIQGEPGPADWNALPDINPKAIEHSRTQTFCDFPGLIIQNDYPLLKAESPLAGQDDFWLYFYQNRAIIMRDRDKDGAAETPHPLDLRDDPKELYIYQARTWHSENFPQEKGTWNPYPMGSGWGHNSAGTYSRQGNHVIIWASVIISQVGSTSSLVIDGLPFSSIRPHFQSLRITNLQGLPSQYSLFGYVSNTVFIPQYSTGSTASYVGIAVSNLTSGTQLIFTAIYEI